MNWWLSNEEWRNKAIDALSRLNITIYNKDGTLKTIFQIFEEIKEKWEYENEQRKLFSYE